MRAAASDSGVRPRPVDRMDDGTLRVVDYKTGGVHLEFGGLDDLFLSKNRGVNGNIFQTLLYSLMLWHRSGTDARPALYYVRRINRPDYSPDLIDRSGAMSDVRYSACGRDFEAALRENCGSCSIRTPLSGPARSRNSVPTAISRRSAAVRA